MIQLPKKYLHTPLALSVAAVLSGIAPIDAEASSVRLEEIIVTSTKRDEMLSDVPISVSAMSGEKIQEAGIPSFADFSAYIPNFAVSPSAIGDVVSIRGIQSGILASIEQSVGTYVDGVYRGRATQSRFSFLDVGVIEVLRGPQGTLFGKNTIGGALNITSAAPTYEFDSAISLLYEVEHEETEVLAHVSGPVSDTVTARLAIMSRELDKGWVENDYKNPAASNDPVQTYKENGPVNDEMAGRFSLNWDANDDLAVKFKIEHGEWDNSGQPFEEAIVTTSGPGNLKDTYAALGVPGDITPMNMQTAMGNNTPGIDYGSVQIFDGDTDESALQFDYLTDSGTITGILAYSAYEFERSLDADFNAFDGIGFEEFEEFDQTSLELRYVFEVGEAEYIVGTYWQTSDLEIGGKSNFNVDPADGDSLGPIAVGSLLKEEVAPGVSIAQYYAMQGGYIPTGDPVADGAVYLSTAIGAAGSIGQFTRGAITEQESDTIAVFGQGTWTLTDTLRLTVGARYGEESKDAVQDMYCMDWDTYDRVGGTGDCTAPLQNVLGEFQEHTHDLERTEYQTTGNATLSWDTTDEIMTYVTIASGVKSGGFNSFALLDGPAGAAEAEFEEEEVISFEIGAKMMLLDGAAELNVAVFDMDYDDLQATIFTGSTGFKVENAASATVRGIEVDGRWQAAEGLQIRGSLGYLDFEFDEYDNAGCTNQQKVDLGFKGLFTKPATGSTTPDGKATAVGDNGMGIATTCEQDLSGGTNPFTPELSANVSIEYDIDLDGFYIRTVIDANYQDEHETTSDNDSLATQGSFTTVNTTITFGPEDDAWDVSLIGRNITDEEYINYSNDMPLFAGNQQVAWGRPANYAIRGRMRF